MATDNKKTSVFERAIAIAGLALAALGLFDRSSSDLIRYGVVFIGVIVALTLLLTEVRYVFTRIWRWLFPRTLSKSHAYRLEALLGDMSNHMSYSYTHSPFYVWRECSNKYDANIRMNYRYHGAVHSWLEDLRSRLKESGTNKLLLVCSLSKAILEAVKLAEAASDELNELLRSEAVPEREKRRVQKDWDSAKDLFNHWISDWKTLFHEISISNKEEAPHYLPPLKSIGE